MTKTVQAERSRACRDLNRTVALDSGVLPRWTGWLAHIAAALCLISVPAMFTGPIDGKGFYNPGGWGPAIVANFPPLIWFLVVGVVLIRSARANANTPVVAQQPRRPA